ncbi:MAG TPA: hypothetical protein VGE09_06220 [Pseudoxanthomonas sp.]
MATFETPNAGAYATSDRAGQVVINDHQWDVEAGKTNGDYIKVGELPAYHQLDTALSEIFAIAEGGVLAAQNLDVFIGDTPTADNTVVDNLAVVANTEQRAAVSTHLAGYKLGVSSVNRPIYLLLNTAPATGIGQIVFRCASFPK